MKQVFSTKQATNSTAFFPKTSQKKANSSTQTVTTFKAQSVKVSFQAKALTVILPAISTAVISTEAKNRVLVK